MILAVISLSALIFFQRYEGTRRFAAAALKGAHAGSNRSRSGKARLAAMLCGIVFSLIFILPVATLALVSFARDGTGRRRPSACIHARELHAHPHRSKRGGGIRQQLGDGRHRFLRGTTLELLVWPHSSTGKTRGSGRRLLSLLVLVPWALPGTVVAISIAEAYGKPSPLLGSYILVGTFWILPVVYFLRFMPLVVRAVQASMEQLDPALNEAAGSLGARWWQRFSRITLPLVWPGAMAGTLLAFVIALGEYVASVLVFVPTNRPISIAIASELRDFNLGSAAAYGMVLILIIAVSMIVAAKLERSRV